MPATAAAPLPVFHSDIYPYLPCSTGANADTRRHYSSEALPWHFVPGPQHVTTCVAKMAATAVRLYYRPALSGCLTRPQLRLAARPGDHVDIHASFGVPPTNSPHPIPDERGNTEASQTEHDVLAPAFSTAFLRSHFLPPTEAPIYSLVIAGPGFKYPVYS